MTKVQTTFKLSRSLDDKDLKNISRVHAVYGIFAARVQPSGNELFVEYDCFAIVAERSSRHHGRAWASRELRHGTYSFRYRCFIDRCLCSVVTIQAIGRITGTMREASDFRRSSRLIVRTCKNLKWRGRFARAMHTSPNTERRLVLKRLRLYVEGKLFVATPLGRILALDPKTGKQLWAFDAHVNREGGYGDFANRGVSTWVSPAGKRRIYIATIDARLIAVDAKRAKPAWTSGTTER